ncbi:multiprotein-bridging factor 1 family protein [Streptomyces sp. NPDC057298]|uniref:helix-turn-helix domain-containing protein n=1 Tax=Streptomyces sp. NPDC057298 TaxID=3346091 RepID=UPI00362EEE26
MAGVTQDPEAWARLGAKIRERREALGWSRRQLSEIAGVSEKSIQVAEEGRTPRARWPQSLRLIESALRWESGSMEIILNGGEAEESLSLFPLTSEEGKADGREQLPMFPKESREDEGIPGAVYGDPPSVVALSGILAELPQALRNGLPYVLEFGRRAVDHGADGEVVERYEEALEALLIDLTSRPLGYVGRSPDPGGIALWRGAVRTGPFLRREKADEVRLANRERLRLLARAEGVYRMTAPGRTPVVGESITSEEVLQELRKLSTEVAELSKRVDQGAAGRQSDDG